jgi:metal-responsive CopG/Arc/MetJ family transcriptional regulator
MRKIKNVTFSIPVVLLDKFKEYAKEKYIPSLSAGVKQALEEYAKKIEKEKLYKIMLEASKDSLFIKDLEDSMRDFEFSDTELIRGEREW